MLSPTQGFTYNKFEKPSDWPDIKKTFDYQIENGKLLGANDYIELKGGVDYTVVGNPTIVDGVISEFSANDNIKLNSQFSFPQTKFSFVTSVNTGSDVQTLQFIFTVPVIQLYIYQGKLKLQLNGGDAYLNGTHTVDANSHYEMFVNYENGEVSLSFKKDGGALVDDGSLAITFHNLADYPVYGVHAGVFPFLGSVDLNSTYIKINGALWFGKKYRRTEESNGVVTKSTIPVPEGLKIGNYTVPYNGMYDIISQTLVEDCSFYPINRTDTHFLPVDNNKLVGPIDYTVVGSPTIVDGVASGFSNNDYLISDTIPDNTRDYMLHAEFTTGTTFTGKAVIVGTYEQLYGSWGFILNSSGDLNANIYLTNGDDTTQSNYYEFGTGVTVTNNQKYYAELYFSNKNKNIISKVSTDGENWTTQTVSVYDNAIPGSASFNRVIGFGKGQEGVFNGSIDLNSTYIKINGALWFGRETWKPSIYDTNCMIELVGHTSDYSSYNNYGFTPTVSNGGTYNVWIDNQKVKENIASETATQLSWSDLALTTGYIVTTPSSLKAHVVKIEPSVDTNTLTGNLVTRVSSSGTEQQGRLHQIIGTRGVFSLNRVSGSDGSVTSPVLKSLDSFTGELNSNTLVYSFYDTNLEHIPTIAMNGASSMYDGLGAFQQTKIKYVALKGTNTLKEASKFFDTPTLEKIDSENTLEFNTGDFGNNKKLKMLPKGTFVNSNYSEFLINDSSLLPTDLDLSSSNTITKLDVYGTSDYRIDGLKSLLVSNEAPFTGTSPQINVSYTGLDRDALVDLFNSMPYNVGYTVVGSPTITNGVASNFSDNDYFTISTTFDLSKAWEIVINYDYGTATPSTMGVLLGGRGHYFQWQVLTNGQISYAMDDKDGNTKYGFVEGLTTKENSFFKMVYDPTNKEITCYKGTNGLNWTQEGGANTVDLTGCSCTFDIGSGVNSYGTGFPIVGSVNFNNTLIKINNILWFNGQAATAKSVNITECAGTSDLTNDDKTIVTNKGWTIIE